MSLRNILIFDLGLVVAACLVPLTPVIAQGMTTETIPGEGRAQITRIQQDLNDNGFSVTVTGSMDAQTSAALRRFQQQHGLPPTGQPDTQTFTELEGVAEPVLGQAAPVMAVPAAPPAPPPG
jgi:peptidoglycan hydrolase-like protein with peptidoglycan-binding domain